MRNNVMGDKSHVYAVYFSYMSNKGFHTGLKEDPKSKLYVFTTPLFMCLCNHFTLVSRPLSVVFCWKTDCTPAVLQMSTSGF